MSSHSLTRKKDSSARILEAARVIAARDGAAHVSLDAIAKEAGLSKGGVLYNFPSKRHLMAALLDEMLAEHDSLGTVLPQDIRCRTLHQHILDLTTMDARTSDLSMAILAVASLEPDLLDPLRRKLEADLARIESETTDKTLAHVIFFALQGLRFHKLLTLPDGGAPVRDEVFVRLQEMIKDA